MYSCYTVCNVRHSVYIITIVIILKSIDVVIAAIASVYCL